MSLRIPLTTYRLQLHQGFTFAHATKLIPYLQTLGVSHIYCSPYLKARPGSTHGYDIVDHSAINPEVGSDADFEQFVAVLRAHNMGQIVDLVPNHMGVAGADNPWWMDVLENGQASTFGNFFDIDWHPAKIELHGKVLLPLLEDQYGAVLERGLLELRFDVVIGEFYITYYEHRLPIDPKTYPLILRDEFTERGKSFANDRAHVYLEELIAFCDTLPDRNESTPERSARRRDDVTYSKRRLSELCQQEPSITNFIQYRVELYNGLPGDPKSFELLHALLEQQGYRLAYWRVAADEINYRRFFDINTLAGLCMEQSEVFEATHRLILNLIAQDKIQGLRLDHPDGLYDPASYFERLQKRVATVTNTSDIPAIYTVVEKILMVDEVLPDDWLVHGTTGYELVSLLNGLFVQPENEHLMSEIYTRFIEQEPDYEELLYFNKKLVMRVLMAGELMVLANSLDQISEANRSTRDYTLHALRDALMEFVACFSVYRTYVTDSSVSNSDQLYIKHALAQARKRSRTADITIFDFLERILLLEGTNKTDSIYKDDILRFVMKLQQYTAPVMAKGFEDTSYYIYNRLISLNEVGGDPRRFRLSINDFHNANIARIKNSPHGMVSTSTHDTKRSEDVRVRISVLSEIPEEWRMRIARWTRLNADKKFLIAGEPAPSRNDEYLLYQSLLGAWPLGVMDQFGLHRFRDRIEAYMLKAVREAKVNTSWINPDVEYEEALINFIRVLLSNLNNNSFLTDFIKFEHEVAHLGMLNSLSQAIIKFTLPGVPDIYQGNEIFDFSLVDPDNRRPVDYAHRQNLLIQLQELTEAFDSKSLAPHIRALYDKLDDGRIKIYVTWRALTLRREYASLFRDGNYVPLAARGKHAECICAYARCLDTQCVVTLATRWFTRLPRGSKSIPDQATWSRTYIEVPSGSKEFENVLTGETVSVKEMRDGKYWVATGEALAYSSVALLRRIH